MKKVALISQTLRAGHCVAYVSDHPADWTILTTDPEAILRAGDTPPGVEVAHASPPPHILPPSELSRNRRYRSVVTWARSGSKGGRWVEASGRWLMRHIKSDSGHTTVSDPEPDVGDADVRDSEMFRQLVISHRDRAVGQLVVFDLFDLPVAMAFADDFDVEVSVR